MFNTPAERLCASVAWRAGQAVVAGVCVSAPVFPIVVEAGVRYFFALRRRNFAYWLGNTAVRMWLDMSMLSWIT